MAVWNVVKNYWKKSKEFASKHFSVKRIVASFVAIVCIFGLWAVFSGPSTEVNSTTTTNTASSSQNAVSKKEIMKQLNEIFKKCEVPSFTEGNGSYFCDADINTEEFQLAYESVEKYNQIKVSLFKQIAEYFTLDSASFSFEVKNLIRKIQFNIEKLDRFPQKIRNSILFEANFENHLQILDDASKIRDQLHQLSNQINQISYDNLTKSSQNLIQSCDSMKSKLAKFPTSFKKAIAALNSVSSFDAEIKKKVQIEYPQFIDDNGFGLVKADKSILIENLSQEIEEKKALVRSQLQDIRQITYESENECERDFMRHYSIDSFYLSVSYLRRSVMYKDVFKFIKKLSDEYVSMHQQN